MRVLSEMFNRRFVVSPRRSLFRFVPTEAPPLPIDEDGSAPSFSFRVAFAVNAAKAGAVYSWTAAVAVDCPLPAHQAQVRLSEVESLTVKMHDRLVLLSAEKEAVELLSFAANLSDHLPLHSLSRNADRV